MLGDFLAQDLADEFQLAVAPFFVAEPGAPRLAVPAGSPATPMTLAETRRVGEMVLLRYLLGPGGPEHRFLRWAIELPRLCPPSGSAFSIGVLSSSARTVRCWPPGSPGSRKITITPRR